MKSEFILSPLSQFEVLSLIGLNAPILNYSIILNTILHLLGLFLFSMLLNLTVLGVIKKGLLGFNLKISLNCLFEKNINLICLFSFFVFILLKLYLGFNVIGLENSEVVLSATMENVKLEVNGDVLKLIFDNLGNAGVFIAGTRIAAALIAKHPIGIIPPAGVIGGAGSGFTIAYKIINETMSPNTSSSSASVSVSPIKITLNKTMNPSITDVDLLEKLKSSFGIHHQSIPKIQIKEEYISGKLYLKNTEVAEVEVKSKVIEFLDRNNPN